MHEWILTYANQHQTVITADRVEVIAGALVFYREGLVIFAVNAHAWHKIDRRGS